MAVQKSTKMKRVSLIRNEIVNTLNNNQNVKRYLTYFSNQPLELEGRLKDGTIINQPNVEDDLVFEKPVIIPTIFTETLLSEAKVIVFVHPHTGSLKELDIGKQVYLIEIVCPSQYYLLYENEDRSLNIACELMNELDQELVGGNGFERYNFSNFQLSRLSNTSDYSVLSLFVEVNALTMKMR